MSEMERMVSAIVEEVLKDLQAKGAVPGIATPTGAPGPAPAPPLPTAEIVAEPPAAGDDLSPARLRVGRAGPRPTTASLLRFRIDHAAAQDAVWSEVPDDWPEANGLLTVHTQAAEKELYLTRPDLGRRLTPESLALIKAKCRPKAQVQIVVGDGLSARAVMANVPHLMPALLQSLQHEGLEPGTPFFVRHARVGVMDDIGEALEPESFILLVGERPGLATAESLSAYICYRPRHATIESDRQVLSNIHRAGTPPLEAGAYLGGVMKQILTAKASGIKLAKGAG